MAKLLAAALALALPRLSSAYTWSFSSPPTQCGNVSISVQGGSPPYAVLVVPIGISPLPNNIEARKIQDETSQSAAINFQLKFPANSQFVVVLSDSTGFASGGTSVGVLVGPSSDSSCFDASQNVAPQFPFNVFPQGLIAQCVPTRIWWNPSQVQGQPKFQGVIPGGQSFQIPQGALSDVSGQGTGFNWTPPLRGMTTLLLVGGDNRGNGSAGSVPYTVGAGPNNDVSCLSSDSPSSTPGAPAGGSYQTSTSASGSSESGGGKNGGNGGGHDGSSGSKTNVAAIAGGTVGGIALLLVGFLVGLFLMRRRRLNKERKDRPDLLTADEGDEGAATRNELPQFYQPEPFMATGAGRSSVGGLTADGRRTSAHTDVTDGRPISGVMSESRSGTPDPSSMSTSTRKSAPMRQMRPVNIIQHADAGPSGPHLAEEEEEPETVELPPAYTNIRK
ncbi:hypothetical protein B0H15DRAFT_944595 [Mycena belliarum]|uniref:Epidermal growth factor receptor-like transmembrane-juxtamembrane segment domain-containing protein n=1 Tax=Mycena belliarum TaxID=1033014 RepID=A0AAD6XSM4_9AGAR|nr:hypothetical protein B0H15DRAFT_944595 [Mycena belliae]